jgi:hypothetical protein
MGNIPKGMERREGEFLGKVSGGTTSSVISIVEHRPPRAPEPLVWYCSASRVENIVV